MSTYRTYKVKLKDIPDALTIQADDVELSSEGDAPCTKHYFNFIQETEINDAQTVAAIPFDLVISITS